MNTTGKKFGGRAAGTPNRVTSKTRGWITSFLEERKPDFEADWGELTPYERFQVLDRLLKYLLPQKAAIDLNRLGPEDLDEIISAIQNADSNE